MNEAENGQVVEKSRTSRLAICLLMFAILESIAFFVTIRIWFYIKGSITENEGGMIVKIFGAISAIGIAVGIVFIKRALKENNKGLLIAISSIILFIIHFYLYFGFYIGGAL